MKWNIVKLIIVFIFCFSASAHAQIIKFNNSLSLNWSNNGAGKIFKYNPSVGVEYFERKYFMLSSSIGIDNKAEKYPIINNKVLEANIRYIRLSTTARFKYDTNYVSFFIGAGPAVNWKKKSIYKIHGEMAENQAGGGEFRAKKNVVDVIGEAGMYKDFDKCRIELFASYNTNLTRIIPESRRGFISHSLALNIALGYKF